MAKMHPITQMPLEDGHGHLPEHVQAAHHCEAIERGGDKERADELRGRLGILTAEEVAAAARKQDEMDQKARDVVPAVKKLHDRVGALEANATEVAENSQKHSAWIAEAGPAMDAVELGHTEHAGLIDELRKGFAALETRVAELEKSKKDN